MLGSRGGCRWVKEGGGGSDDSNLFHWEKIYIQKLPKIANKSIFQTPLRIFPSFHVHVGSKFNH